ncbi:MAG: PD40 domain-containing protein [Anaerolineae bacterium]|nr:PD40 domain-containing protein [Anaerolineae bacterium]
MLDVEHDTGPEQFAPSPDGQTIAYGGGSTGWLYHWDSGMETFDPSAYGLDGIKIGSPSWSPDGTRLAWVVGGGLAQDGGWQIAIGIFDLETHTVQLVHPYEPVGRGGWPPAAAWSPDGKWLAFAAWEQTSKVPSIWVLRADGQQEEEYALGPGDTLTWSPDGRWLAFNAVSETGESTIRVAETGTWHMVPLDLLSDARLVSWIDSLGN